MNWKTKTIIFIVVMVVVIFVYDWTAIYFGGIETSVSQTLIVWSYKFPILTFSFGVVMGHLFWRIRDTKESAKITENIENIP